MSTELLPCPFCGGEAETFSTGSHWVAQCPCCKNNCQMGIVSTVAEPLKKNAIRQWNRRFALLDRKGDKVFVGDEVRTAFRGRIALEPTMVVMFGDKPNSRFCCSREIELVKEAK